MQTAHLNLHGKWLLGILGPGDHDGIQLVKIGFGDGPPDMGGTVFERDCKFICLTR